MTAEDRVAALEAQIATLQDQVRDLAAIVGGIACETLGLDDLPAYDLDWKLQAYESPGEPTNRDWHWTAGALTGAPSA